jgi:hypothetical protein
MSAKSDAATLEADELEHQLLDRLIGHTALQNIEALPQQQLLQMLLQRRFISHIFTTVYDIGIDGLANSDALKVARQIVREEYPDPSGRKPSHREDLVDDLIILGATRAEVLASRPTAATTSTVIETLDLIADAAADPSDVPALTMLRFWGEVVVSVEYGKYWRRIAEAFQAPDRRSRFFYEHYSHDGCEPLTGASMRTHSGRLGVCLREMLRAPGAFAAFADVETRVLETRLRFYDQFA